MNDCTHQPKIDLTAIASTAHSSPQKIRAVTVYCSARDELAEVYFDAARTLGRLLAESGRTLVYGGGNLGLMGCIADAVHQHGGRVHGIITEKLTVMEQARLDCDTLETVVTMRDRKHRMEVLADAFLALPGGIGTFEELLEMIVARFLGEHSNPIILINTKHYFDPFVQLIEQSMAEGFMRPGTRELIQIVDTPEEAMQILNECSA